MKILSIYLPIYNFVADEFVKLLSPIDKSEDIEIWMNCPGGSVFAGWGIIGPISDRTGKTICKVYGDASSMALYMLLFMDYVESIDVSNFTLHRADGYIESDEDQLFLDNINKILREKLEQRIDTDIFEKITKGITLNDIFDTTQRIEVNLSAKDMKKLGLVNKIIQLDAKDKGTLAITKNFVALIDNIGSRGSDLIDNIGSRGSEGNSDNNNTNKLNQKKMTKQELKAQYPEIFEEVFTEGNVAGVKAEQMRVKSWLAYLNIDKENVIASVKEGKEFTTDVMAEMQVKLASKVTAMKIESDSPEKIATDKTDDKTSEQKEVEAFMKEVDTGVKKITL